MGKIARYIDDLLWDPYFCRDELAKDPDNYMAKAVHECYEMAWETLDHSLYPTTDKNCYEIANHICSNVMHFEWDEIEDAYKEYKEMDYDEMVPFLKHFLDDYLAENDNDFLDKGE